MKTLIKSAALLALIASSGAHTVKFTDTLSPDQICSMVGMIVYGELINNFYTNTSQPSAQKKSDNEAIGNHFMIEQYDYNKNFSTLELPNPPENTKVKIYIAVFLIKTALSKILIF